jgi:hypothetical protein
MKVKGHGWYVRFAMHVIEGRRVTDQLQAMARFFSADFHLDSLLSAVTGRADILENRSSS